MIYIALIALSFSLLLYALYTLILKPWRLSQFYSKQGCSMTFSPILNSSKEFEQSLDQFGDIYGGFKKKLKQNPELKAIGKNILSQVQLHLVDPDEINEFYRQQHHYIKSTSGMDYLQLFLGEGLSTSDGKVWKRHRKVISASFHYDFLKKIIPDVAQIAHQMLENLKQKDLEDVETMKVFESITGEVVGILFFGTNFSDCKIDGIPITAYLSSITSRIGVEAGSVPYLLFGAKAIKYGVLPRYKKIMQDLEKMSAFTRNTIEMRKAEIEKEGSEKIAPKTLIDSLILSSDFTPKEIFDELMTFFVTGMETTGHLIGMAVYYLSQNPQFKSRLIKEGEEYIKDPSQVTVEALNKMEFTTAFLTEALRLGTPGDLMTDRIALEDHQLKGLKIKKGTVININVIGNNSHPSFYEKEDEFDPERWINNSKTKSALAKNPKVFIPFSAGPHNCIGQHLAMNQAKIILSMFLKKFDFVLSPAYEHKMTLRIVYEPLNRMSFKLIPK